MPKKYFALLLLIHSLLYTYTPVSLGMLRLGYKVFLNQNRSFITSLKNPDAQIDVWISGNKPRLECTPDFIQQILQQDVPRSNILLASPVYAPEFQLFGEMEGPHYKHGIVNINTCRPIHWAIKNKRYDILTRLLEHPYIDVNERDEHYHTALMAAVKIIDAHAAEILLTSSFLDVNLTNNAGNTAFEMAFTAKDKNSESRLRIMNLLATDPRCIINSDLYEINPH